MTQDHPIPVGSDSLAIAFGHYRSRQYAQTLELCKTILNHDPDQFDALYLSGLATYRMGDPLAADRLIDRACRARPEIDRFDYLTAILRQQGKATWLTIRERRLREYYTFSEIDGFMISYPKCGRTWLRIMLGRYLLQGREGDPLKTRDITRADPDLPTIKIGHDDFPQWKSHTDLHADKSMYHEKSVVFLVRDPRDVVVSAYFSYTKRGGKLQANDAGFHGSLSDYIRHTIGGIFSLVEFYNIWARNRHVPKAFHLARYEDFHADVHGEFARLIEFFGFPNLGQDAIDDAVSFASFDNMRRLEENNTFDNPMLQARSDGHPEGFKVRRGVVGGYRDYLDDEDIAFINDYLGKELDDFYADYKVPSRN